jgi:hypothetical protein
MAGAACNDTAAVGRHQFADHSQADAKAAPVNGNRTLILHEQVENTRQRFCRDADSVVGHGDHDGLMTHHPGEGDATPFAGVLGGVVQQVAKNLVQPHGVAVHGKRTPRQIDSQVLQLCVHCRHARVDRHIENADQIDRGAFEVKLATVHT